MTRAKWIAVGLVAVSLSTSAGLGIASAQAPAAPTTKPAPFIKPLLEPVEPPATKPAGAPYIPPIGEPATQPTTAGPLIKPIREPVTKPASRPSTQPASQATTKPVGPPQAVAAKTQGYSEWVPVEPGTPCVDLSLMPADVREFWQKHCTTRGRILAERAAKDAAVARLARRVGKMAIAPGLTVRQFLAVTNQPDADEELFLRGAIVVAVRYHVDKLVVEVQVEIYPRTVFASLKGWARSRLNGDRAGLRKIETVLLKADDTPLRQTGLAGPPADEILKPTPELLRAARAATQPGGATVTLPAKQPSTPATASTTTQP